MPLHVLCGCTERSGNWESAKVEPILAIMFTLTRVKIPCATSVAGLHAGGQKRLGARVQMQVNRGEEEGSPAKIRIRNRVRIWEPERLPIPRLGELQRPCVTYPLCTTDSLLHVKERNKSQVVWVLVPSPMPHSNDNASLRVASESCSSQARFPTLPPSKIGICLVQLVRSASWV